MNEWMTACLNGCVILNKAYNPRLNFPGYKKSIIYIIYMSMYLLDSLYRYWQVHKKIFIFIFLFPLLFCMATIQISYLWYHMTFQVSSHSCNWEELLGFPLYFQFSSRMKELSEDQIVIRWLHTQTCNHTHTSARGSHCPGFSAVVPWALVLTPPRGQTPRYVFHFWFPQH